MDSAGNIPLLDLVGEIVGVSVAGLDPREKAEVEDRLANDWTQFIKGVGVRMTEPAGATIIALARMSSKNPALGQLLRTFWSNNQRSMLKKNSMDPLMVLQPWTGVGDIASACRNKLALEIPELSSGATAGLCQAATWAVEQVALGTFAPGARNFYDEGGRCMYHCDLVATFEHGDIGVQYFVTMQGYIAAVPLGGLVFPTNAECASSSRLRLPGCVEKDDDPSFSCRFRCYCG